MAELLTNNPNALKSTSGLTPEIPCSGIGNGPLGTGAYYLTGSRTHLPVGFIGRLLPCSYTNFFEWFATLQARYSILYRNYTKILADAKLHENNPDKQLTNDEIQLGFNIEDIKSTINNYKGIKQGLDAEIYYRYITEIQSALASTNSLIETVQNMMEEPRRKIKYIPTGIPNYSNPITDTFKTVLLVVGVGFAGWAAVKLWKYSIGM